MIKKKDIYRILTEHIKRCKVFKAISRAMKPFILIDPKEKTEDLWTEIKKRKKR